MDLHHPAAEVEVDASLVGFLLETQHPALLAGPPELVDEGWDNFTFRVGADHAVRIPRRRVAVDLLLHEQRWLPTLAGWLSVDVPIPVAVGGPSDVFPWPWSVVTWVHGETAEDTPLGLTAAEALATELRSLHRPGHPAAPANAFRGVPLGERRAPVEARLAELGLPELGERWSAALAAPPSESKVWLHGDLHGRNVIVRGGTLAGLIDWGDLTSGDVATDLACAWTLFDARGRAAFLEAYGATQPEVARAAGWAVNFGTALATSGEARHAHMGREVIRRLVETDD